MSQAHDKRVVVMTGATSGIGANAAMRIATEPSIRLIIGARGGHTGPQGAEVVPLDLASLASVRTFASEVKRSLGGAQIDMLVLNAGVQTTNATKRTIDGFEVTFAVNHLAHYLLARMLVPLMSDSGRLVVTTSDTHDPAIFSGAPKTLDPEALAHPDRNKTGVKFSAYPASKLCDLLMARSFAALSEVQPPHITAIAYNPGLTLGTGLSRDAPRLLRLLMRGLIPLIGVFKPQFRPGSPERAGEALAQLALGEVNLPPGRVYASLVKGKLTFPDPSPLARNDNARDQLWRESAIMVGLS
ncbi:MAG TPA: SDR family NAD(P)-dependent oxidoreductase [Nitrososphaerales archaeon]|nr:SDR family NAD(P)-dependent oxidoreductase [Nitrososphaerales archaeon]